MKPALNFRAALAAEFVCSKPANDVFVYFGSLPAVSHGERRNFFGGSFLKFQLKMDDFVPESSVLRGSLILCFKLGQNTTEAHETLRKAYGAHSLGISTVKEWYNKFKDGDFSVENKPRGHAPKAFDDIELEAALKEDEGQTQQQLAERLGVDRSTISRRLKAIGKIHKQGKWVPHTLTDRMQERRKTTCEVLLERQQRKGFLHRIVTGDEKWIYFENPKRQKCWVTPGTPAKSYPKPNRFGKKAMLCVFWDQKGLVYYELLKPGETVTANVYTRQMGDLAENLDKKRPEWRARHEGVILLHDNAPAHAAKSTKIDLQSRNWEVLPHPPYSPDLAPSDFHLFTSMQHDLSSREFKKYEDAQEWVEKWFGEKNQNFFRRGIQKLPEKWAACIASEGNYFE